MLITLNHLKSSLQAVKTYINNVLPKKVSDLVDDSGHYTKPSGGIPASDLADGVIPVEDVQVNGTSILNNGVANVPIHTGKQKNAFGVVRTSDALGVSANNDGQLYIYKPSALEIKGGTHQYRPIVPTVQDASTFYGLAKAAGDSTQSASSNAVGTYTDDAKVAIQKMLGIYEAPWELINEETFTNAEEADYIITTDSNNESLDLTDVIILFETPPQDTYAAKGTYGQIWICTDGASSPIVQAECGAWTQNANAAAHGCGVMLERKGNIIISNVFRSTTSSNTMMSGIRYGAKLTSATNGIRMIQANINKITIPKVTGTGHYILYGKRNWQ